MAVEKGGTKAGVSTIPSGIDGLDVMLAGGFVKNHSVLVCGPPGIGKTTFAFQFLCHGAKNGEPGAYISFDEEEGRLIANMSAFSFGIEELVDKDLLRVQKVGALEIQQFASQESILLIEIIRSIGAKRVVVDSLTSYELLFKEDYERLLYVRRLVDEILGRGCTVLATSEAVPGKLSRFQLAEFVFDTVISLDIDPVVRTKRTMEIIKNRGNPHKLGKSIFEINTDGFSIK